MKNRVDNIAMLARAGYVARAVVYFALGYLTLATGEAEGATSVLDELADVPGGTPLMVFLSIGLAAYGLFRIYGAWVDLENDGDDAIGTGTRIGHVASGLAHLFLAYLALSIGLGGGSTGSEGAAGGEAARTMLDMPGGQLLVGAIGVAFGLAALNQAVKAATGKFMGLLGRDAPRWAESVGRIGFAARAAVFAALAWTIIDAAGGGGARDISFQNALAAYRDQGSLYQLIAGGLLVFGIFSLVMARYRDICDSPIARRLLGR